MIPRFVEFSGGWGLSHPQTSRRLGVPTGGPAWLQCGALKWPAAHQRPAPRCAKCRPGVPVHEPIREFPDMVPPKG